MKIERLLIAAVLSSALLGCATPPLSPTAERRRCDTNECTIPIHVVNCVITAPDIDVHGHDRAILWVLDRESQAAGYRWPDIVVHLGVFIKDDPKDEFQDPKRIDNKTFKLHDRNSDSGKGAFRYGVRVQRGSAACPDLDPFIVNN